MRKKAVSIVLILADLILLVLFVFVFRGILRSVAGFDVIEYENWNGELENPIVGESYPTDVATALNKELNNELYKSNQEFNTIIGDLKNKKV
ncbi:MAG: hypothetical protein IIT90_05940, partial [Clostridiales bacterium]|nr:hypothetical protein [Clostridiales bacterium]